MENHSALPAKDEADPLAFTRDAKFRAKGKGLNSIPIRFALMGLIVGSAAFALQFEYFFADRLDGLTAKDFAVIGLVIGLPAAVTFFAARKLAGMIGALRSSTLAILNGEIDRPVDVDCECEVGGLADSFRAMVARLNNNIFRMNVLAYTDSVTGLPNRTVLNHMLSLAGQSEGDDFSGSMFFIDLDGFKRINDTLGHDAGDEVLRVASQRIVQQGFRIGFDELESCTTAFGELTQTPAQGLVFVRFAGDEFVALMPGNHSSEELAELGQRIVHSLDEPLHIHGNEVRLGASVGIATFEPDVMTPPDLVGYADIAMYRAKAEGRNRYAFFDMELKAAVEDRAQLEADLRDALARDEFTVEFQPRICAQSRKVMGVEALARWDHPTRGWVDPEIFVPLAEQTGCMSKLGDSILRQAARQASEWHAAGLSFPVAVNMSSAQFDSPQLIPNILEVLGEAGLPPHLLELEITETLAMEDFSASRLRIDELRALGPKVAIDDFGTGFSNLSQLSRLNVDMIKIDRSLVAGIGKSPKSQALLTATIGMAKALGLTLVAEGIETVEQFEKLRVMGCDQAQGFLVAHPMNASDLLAWQEEHRAEDQGAFAGDDQARLAI